MDMDDIGKLLGSLSAEDMSMLKEKAQSILGTSEPEKKKEESGLPNMDDFLNPEMLFKITKLMSMLNQKDSRADLISALKPLLGEDKRKKADEAMQIMRLLNIMPLLQQQFGNSENDEKRSEG
ncbi:MAG TPA: hypothetical protein VFD52_01110 [Clostridia bacterium]|nr:hypothetical protein [Clostridia bacterium]